MTWWAVGSTVVSTGASLYNAKKNRDAAKDLAKDQAKLGTATDLIPKQIEMDKSGQLWAQEQNKANSLWANDINQGNLAKQTELNRPNWSREGFGSGAWNEANNQYDLTLDPTQKANLDLLRGKETGLISGMGGGFDVNGDVMNAYRAIQNPMLAKQREAENARLAAQGLSTGSGSAWMNAQDTLNNAENQANQQAILAGFQADQSLRQSNRADLGALGTVENQMSQNLAAPTFQNAGTTAVGAPTVSAPNASLYNAWTSDQNAAQGNYASQVAGNQQYSDLGNAAGGIVKSLGGVDWGNMFGSTTGNGNTTNIDNLAASQVPA